MPQTRHRRAAASLAAVAAVLAAAGTTASFALGAAPAAAASSTRGIDTAFGSSGVSTAGASGSDVSAASAVATVPPCPSQGSCRWSAIAGDVVAAGSGISGATGEFVVSVVSATTGKAVTTFGSSGVVTLLGGNNASTGATAVSVYPPCPTAQSSCAWSSEAGDVVVAGNSGGNIDVVVLSPAGAVVGSAHSVAPPLNTTYSAAGVTLETTGGDSPSGDIVVAGWTSSGGGPVAPLLVALGPSGSPDTSFGGSGTGLYTTPIVPAGGSSPSAERLNGITTDPAGNLLVAGTDTRASGEADMLVARFTSTGSLDPTFGASPQGCGTTSSCAGSTVVATRARGTALAVAPLPSSTSTCLAQSLAAGTCYDVLVAGTSAPAVTTTQPTQVAGALAPGGASDGSFGGGHLVSLPAVGSQGAQGLGIAVQSSGGAPTGIAVTGTVNGTGSAPALATVTRLSPAGSLVTGFGSAGVLTFPADPTLNGVAAAAAPAPGGLDFVVAGTFGSASGFAISRVLGEVLHVSSSLAGRPTGWHNADLLSLKVQGSEAAPSGLNVVCRLAAATYVSFAPMPSGSGQPTRTEHSATVSLNATHSGATTRVLALVPAFVGGSSLTVSVSCAPPSGVRVLASGMGTHKLSHASPLGAAPSPGYWVVTSAGHVSAVHAPSLGGTSGHLAKPVVGLAAAPKGGYWITTAAGAVTARDVASRGSLSPAPAAPIVAIATDAATGGYWLFGRDGSVHRFGAPLFGERHPLPSPVVGAAAAPDGLGYFLATANGAVYAFGPGAKLHGRSSTPVVAITADPLTGGYYLVGSTGTVHGFGAPSHGSARTSSVRSIATDPATGGYWIVTSHGKVFALGAPNYGSGTSTGTTVQVTGR